MCVCKPTPPITFEPNDFHLFLFSKKLSVGNRMCVNLNVKQYFDSDLLIFIPLIPTQKIFFLLPYPEYVKLQSSNSQQCNPIAAGFLEILI